MPSRWPADPAAGAPWRAPAALAVMVASGFAGLGYQIVWTQQCALWLGHESAALLAVVTAFFGGLALGALAFGARIERSAQPARWYAAGEGVVALWSLALLGLMGPVSAGLLALTGARPAPAWQWAVAFAGTFLMLLPATASMGATLPAMARLLAPLRWQARRVAALYACNTLGAVIGVLAAAFWLVPTWGLARTAGLCAVLSGLCAGAALALLLAVYLVGTALGAAAYARGWAGPPEPDLRQAGPLHAAPQDRRADRLLCALALACLLGAASLWAADSTRDAVQRALGPGMAPALAAEATLALAAFLLPTVLMGALFSHLTLRARSAGVALGRALGANTLGAAAAPLLLGVLALPALGAKGALLALLLGYLALLLRRAWARPGAWVAAGLVPRWRWVHRRWCLSMCPTVAASSASVVLHAKRDIKPRLCARDVVENPRDAYGHRCGFRLATGANPSVFLSRAQRATPHYQDGAMAAVSVVEDAAGVRRLRIDNRQQEGSSASRLADSRQAYLPLLLHPAPQRVLFLGLGTGVTAAAAAEHTGLQVDAAELLPEVISAAAFFTPRTGGGAAAPRPGAEWPPGTATGLHPSLQVDLQPGLQPGLHPFAADARRFVRATGPAYDVIVSDNFHPARSGSGALYTVQHFQAVRARLAAGGVFCQWLPLHQLDLDSLRSIVQSFRAVYPGGRAMLATHSLDTPVLGLVARVNGHPGAAAAAGPDGARFKLDQLRQRLAASALAPRLAEVGMGDELALLGGFVAGPAALARFAGAVPPNTDGRPVVAYRAPRITYAPDSAPRDRLLALLDQLKIDPTELVEPGPDGAAAQRLAAYWAARDAFIAAGHGVRPSADVHLMLAQVQAPLLRVLRISADFRPADDPLLRLALALGRTDAAGARRLLAALAQAQPARPEAVAALGRISADAAAH